MAGAGYKLFNTGDVLTAAQVNTYLMEQTVMVFADAAARTTALTGVVSEGMISYLKDTNAVEVYNGSAWVASDDPNAIQNTIVDAKGDLITATAADTPARLAVGNNGETLVADSSATTGLRWQGNFAAGKNKIINGDFSIWQRGTSFTVDNTYTADRWRMTLSGATATTSRQSFTAGQTDVPNNPTYFLRYAVSVGDNFTRIETLNENVNTFSGQTITISFWAKGTNPAGGSLDVYYVQNFGSGGSTAVSNVAGTFSLTASWARYSFTYAVPSVSGKTIGANNYWQVDIRQPVGDTGVAAWTLDLANVQVEAGSVATDFQTATGTLAGELAACQRYYFRFNGDTNQEIVTFAFAGSTTLAQGQIQFPVPMRVRPTSLDTATLKFQNFSGSGYNMTSLAYNQDSTTAAQVYGTVSGVTAGHVGVILGQTTGSYLGFSAEL